MTISDYFDIIADKHPAGTIFVFGYGILAALTGLLVQGGRRKRVLSLGTTGIVVPASIAIGILNSWLVLPHLANPLSLVTAMPLVVLTTTVSCILDFDRTYRTKREQVASVAFVLFLSTFVMLGTALVGDVGSFLNWFRK